MKNFKLSLPFILIGIIILFTGLSVSKLLFFDKNSTQVASVKESTVPSQSSKSVSKTLKLDAQTVSQNDLLLKKIPPAVDYTKIESSTIPVHPQMVEPLLSTKKGTTKEPVLASNISAKEIGTNGLRLKGNGHKKAVSIPVQNSESIEPVKVKKDNKKESEAVSSLLNAASAASPSSAASAVSKSSLNKEMSGIKVEKQASAPDNKSKDSKFVVAEKLVPDKPEVIAQSGTKIWVKISSTKTVELSAGEVLEGFGKYVGTPDHKTYNFENGTITLKE